MKYSQDGNIDKLVNDLVRTGLLSVKNGSKHFALVKSDGHKYTIPGTPGGGRSYQNWRAGVRRFAPEAFAALNTPLLSRS